MAEDTHSYSSNTPATASFYKQSKDRDKIDIVIKPDPDTPNPLKKIFGGAGMGLHTVVYLSGIISGTLYYNNANDLKGEYTYIVTTTKDSDNKVFCTVKGHKQEKDQDGKVIADYYFEFVASDCFSGSDSVTTLEKGFTNSAEWRDNA